MPKQTPQDFEKTYDDFWKEIVETDGEIDPEKVKRELHDYRFLMQQVPLVYDAVTGSHVSKPNTLASAVIGAFEEHVRELIDQAIEDEREDSEG